MFLHQITCVRWSDEQYLAVATAAGTVVLGTDPGIVYYRHWQPALPFVSARRFALEARLRAATPWSTEDEQEADAFAGDLPVVGRAQDRADARLAAIYGAVIHVHDVRQHITKHTLWWMRHQVEKRFLELRESALLVYQEGVVVCPDTTGGRRFAHPFSSQPRIAGAGKSQCIYLCAVHSVSSPPESPSAMHLATRSKAFLFFFASPAEARTCIYAVQGAVEKVRSNPKRGRIGALERVDHLTTQVTIPRHPHAGGGFANVYKGTWEVAAKDRRPENWQRRTVTDLPSPARPCWFDSNCRWLSRFFWIGKWRGWRSKKFVHHTRGSRPFGIVTCCQKIRREVAVWYRLDHPNVVPLFGITYDFGTSLSMVSPWLPNGTLDTYLKSGMPGPNAFRPLVSPVYFLGKPPLIRARVSVTRYGQWPRLSYIYCPCSQTCSD